MGAANSTSVCTTVSSTVKAQMLALSFPMIHVFTKAPGPLQEEGEEVWYQQQGTNINTTSLNPAASTRPLAGVLAECQPATRSTCPPKGRKSLRL